MIKEGQKVIVMNSRLDGTPFVEGMAVVRRVLEDMHNGFYACKVRFSGDDVDVFRWVDESVQKDGIQ